MAINFQVSTKLTFLTLTQVSLYIMSKSNDKIVVIHVSDIFIS